MTGTPTTAERVSVDTALANNPHSPVSFSLCLIDVGRIRPYEHNPRQVDHPEYDRIKDSIRQAGLDQPLVVTQRPGASDYIVHSGGNTRLSILKALLHETGERRFAEIPCRVLPWHSETDVLLAHLRENDLRGHLTFIDKARAVCVVKRLLATERGVEELSQRQLEAELRQAGYCMTQARISQMIYAVNRLLPLIPLALEQGLGRPQVERIRALERAAKTVWQNCTVGSTEEFREVFDTLCSRYDAPDWEADLLQGALASEIAGALEVSVQTARTMLDVQLSGREWMSLPPVPASHEEVAMDSEEDPPRVDETLVTAGVPWSVADQPPHPVVTPSPANGPENRDPPPRPDDSTDFSTQQNPRPVETAGRDRSTATGPDGPVNHGLARDLPSLRRHAAALAMRLAERHAMGELVIRLPEAGLGFLLRDVPRPVPSGGNRPEIHHRRHLLWSQLAACCDLTKVPAAFLKARIPEASRLRHALPADPASLNPDLFPLPDYHQMGFIFWRHLDDQDWQNLLGLMDTYRLIHQLVDRADAGGASIWTESSSTP